MKVALMKVDGQERLVSLGGEPLLNDDDARERLLHLVPVLFEGKFERFSSRRMALDITCDWTDRPLVPEGGIRIRKAYPNTRYFVGGSRDCRIGWFVPLPEGLDRGMLRMRWEVDIGDTIREFDYQLCLTFLPGEGRIYTMDLVPWWKRAVLPAGVKKGAPVFHLPRICADIEDYGKHRHTLAVESRHDVFPYWRQALTETLEIPPVKLGELWTLREYGGNRINAVLEALR